MNNNRIRKDNPFLFLGQTFREKKITLYREQLSSVRTVR